MNSPVRCLITPPLPSPVACSHPGQVAREIAVGSTHCRKSSWAVPPMRALASSMSRTPGSWMTISLLPFFWISGSETPNELIRRSITLTRPSICSLVTLGSSAR